MNLNRRNFLKGSFVLAGGLLIPAHLAGCRFAAEDEEYDLVVYGGTSGGIVAAVQAARMGLSVIIIEPSNHLGGLTTGGLGLTDAGRADAIGGVSREFYQRLRKYYENDDAWIHEPSSLQKGQDAMWRFEPHVAMKVYKQMIDEAGVPVVMGDRLVLGSQGVEKRGNRITSILTEKGNLYKGRIFIDATYEGDLIAMAGVSYHVGREANAVYGETLNGVQKVRTHYHVFPGFVDPYVIPGNPGSGVLPGVHDEDPGIDGAGDHRVQAYNFRMCLTDVPENRIAYMQPDGYDELEYELLFRNYESGETRVGWPDMMPNRKTDYNNRWGFSTNKIGANYMYPDGDYATREAIIKDHEHYQKGLMWTLANHPRIPSHVREEIGKWGLAADEFTDTGGWPPQIYVREARRMIGEYVMTEHDCRRMRIASDPVGLGSYTMDSHNVQRYITRMGCVQNEGNLEVPTGGPYAISYRSLLPKKVECENLLVCCNAVSASHISFGSIRMEPVFMILGQSAATAAAQSLEEGIGLHDLSYSRLRNRLIGDGQRLDVDTDLFPPILPDKEAPKQRSIHRTEPILENACIVRG